MLESIRAAPSDTACELTWEQRVENILMLLVWFSFVICLIAGLWLYVDLKVRCSYKQVFVFCGYRQFAVVFL